MNNLCTVKEGESIVLKNKCVVILKCVILLPTLILFGIMKDCKTNC